MFATHAKPHLTSGNEGGFSNVFTAIPRLPHITDLVIKAFGADNLLWWSPIPGANDYDVYFAAEPFDDVQQAQFVGTTYAPFFRHVNGNATEQIGFYRVVAR